MQQKYFLNTNITPVATLIIIIYLITQLHSLYKIIESHLTEFTHIINQTYLSLKQYFYVSIKPSLPILSLSGSFILIAIINIVLFPAWSGTHIFWGYYALPGLAILVSLGIKQFFSSSVIGKLVSIFLFLAYFYLSPSFTLKYQTNLAASQQDISRYHQLARQISPDQVIFSNEPLYDFGPARRLRYYADRPIYIAKSKSQAQASGYYGRFWVVRQSEADFASTIPGVQTNLDPDLILIDTQTNL